MVITKKALVNILEKLGYNASEWNKAKLAKQIKKLKKLVEETTDIDDKLDDNELETLLQLVNAKENKEKISIKTGTGGKKKKAKAKKKTTKSKQTKDSGKGVDKFGSRKTSKAHKINQCLSAEEPKKMPQLVEEAGLEHTFYNHINKLIERGFVEKTGDGYLLVE